MSFGIMFNSLAGKRVIDGNHPVPEFIGKVTLNATPVINERRGTAPYTTRRYALASLPARAGRNAMILWKIPDTGSADVWFSPFRPLVYADETGMALPGMDVFIGDGASAPPLAVGYMFAVGPATAGSEPYGMRVWDAAGVLIFDSSRLHMNLEQIITDVAMRIDTANSYAITTGPVNAAYLVPNAYYMTDVRTEDDQTFVRFMGSVRRNGSILYTFMPETDHFHSLGDPGIYFNDSNYFGNHEGLVIPVINTTLYD